MEFKGIEDAVGKWVIVRFTSWPDDLKSLITGLTDVEGKWLQYKLRGIDNFGIWLENPWFKIELATDSEGEISQDQKEALLSKAFVLVKWQYVATIIYLEGQRVDHIPLGFPTPAEAS